MPTRFRPTPAAAAKVYSDRFGDPGFPGFALS
jgi:hypothetical protein